MVNSVKDNDERHSKRRVREAKPSSVDIESMITHHFLKYFPVIVDDYRRAIDIYNVDS